jgi:hypothetical protein
MKTLRVLFFILMAFKMNSQNDSSNLDSKFKKPKWDIGYNIGGGKQFVSQIGFQAIANVRFKKHIYASVGYLAIGELTLVIPEINPNGASGDQIRNLSLLVGTHYSTKNLYCAIGGGWGSTKGEYWERIDAKNIKKSFNSNGFEIKAQTNLIFWRYGSFGLNYNYNFNGFENFYYFMFGFQFGRLR